VRIFIESARRGRSEVGIYAQAHPSQSQSLPPSGFPREKVPESRSSGAIRSDGAAAEVEQPSDDMAPMGRLHDTLSGVSPRGTSVG
jgi:hypothetical protein